MHHGSQNAAILQLVSSHAKGFIINLLNGCSCSADSQQRMPPTESLKLLSITELVRSNEFIAEAVMAVGHVVLLVYTCAGTRKLNIW